MRSLKTRLGPCSTGGAPWGDSSGELRSSATVRFSSALPDPAQSNRPSRLKRAASLKGLCLRPRNVQQDRTDRQERSDVFMIRLSKFNLSSEPRVLLGSEVKKTRSHSPQRNEETPRFLPLCSLVPLWSSGLSSSVVLRASFRRKKPALPGFPGGRLATFS